MSNALDQQILYLEMDDIEDNVVADASGNELNGNVQGAAQAVADKFFGTAICFNKSSASGTMDYLNVDLSEGLGHALSGSAFTVTAWINPAARLSAQTANGVGNLFFAQGSGTNQDNVQIGFSETGHLQVYLGLTTGAWFTELAENDITIGAWHFVALVFDAGRSQEEIAVYVDNTVYRYAAGTDGVPEVAAITAAHLNVGGTTETDAVYFEGSMHDVRVFDSAQSSDVVGAVKSVDLTTAATPSRQSVLIDFTLLDGSSQPTLYIVDETSRDMTTTLTIENTAARALSIPAVDTLSVDNAPFSLQFRPGVIDDSCYEALDIAATDWQWSIVEEDDSALILLAPKQNMVFDADAALSFVMTGLTAAGEGGARGTRVMLSFQSIGFPDDDGVTDDSVATVSGYRQSFMSIVNQSGKRATPLVMAFVGSNAIINDGSTENSFTISIINPTDYAVSLSTDEDAPTRFTFGLPISDDKTDVAALCTEGQVEAVVVVAEGTGNWTVEASAQAETAEWVCQAANITSIPARSHIEFEFNTVVSSTASGKTLLALHYENLPGYWDGYLTAAIEKGPMCYAGANVGIGTIPDGFKLDVKGGDFRIKRGNSGDNGQIWSGYEGASVALYLYDMDDPCYLKFRNNKKSDVATGSTFTTDLNNGDAYESVISGHLGRIGINTTWPDTPVHLYGHTKIEATGSDARGLDVSGDTTITGDCTFKGDAAVTGDCTISGDTSITGDCTINGNASVTGDCTVNGEVKCADSFVAKGKFGSGSIPATGAGARMMWYPGKSAFRVGSATGTEWDDSKIGDYSVAAGNLVTASALSSIALGSCSSATGIVSLALGYLVTASGANSVAIGNFASTNGKKGAIVIGDSNFTSLNATADNQFLVRASGGTAIYSNSTLKAGVKLAAGGGSWASVSDVNMKDNFSEEDGETALARIAAMPIRSWNYKTQDPAIRHIGPTAQDFHHAFGIGDDDTTITAVDADGIALLAVQALEKRTAELREENDQLRQERCEMEQRLARIETLLAEALGSRDA